MPSLVLCYSPDDEVAVRRIGGYLEANLPCGVSYSEAVLRPGLDLVDATERAIGAEMALVFLSPHSVPASWKLERWKPVFFDKVEEFGSLLGVVLLADCKFPELLRRRSFFDARSDADNETRRIRRWLLRPHRLAAAAIPASAPSDLPGLFDMPFAEAERLAVTHENDFEAVYRADCEGRSDAGVLGDLGHTMGLCLTKTVQENRALLREQSAKHRWLFLVAHATPAHRELLHWGGLASMIFLSDAPPRIRASRSEIDAVFLTSVRDEALCAALLGDAVHSMAELPEPELLRLGWAIVKVVQNAKRFAEAVELLEWMEPKALPRARTDIQRELSWLRDSSDYIAGTAAGDAIQLSLFGWMKAGPVPYHREDG
jgi:hypothetical protein